MNITLNISEELLKEAKGDLTITLNLTKYGQVESKVKPSLAPQVSSQIPQGSQGFNTGSTPFGGSPSLSFAELNNL